MVEDDKDDKKKTQTGGETDAGASTISGVQRPASDMAARTTESDEETARKKRGEGDSESGSASTGTTFVRASGEGVIERLSVEKQKKVWADFRHLDLNEVVAAVAEFFSEFPARASANLTVAWNKGGYAIINLAVKFGQDVAQAVRERTREGSVRIKQKYGISLKFKGRGGVGTTINPNPQAGMQ